MSIPTVLIGPENTPALINLNNVKAVKLQVPTGPSSGGKYNASISFVLTGDSVENIKIPMTSDDADCPEAKAAFRSIIDTMKGVGPDLVQISDFLPNTVTCTEPESS